MNTPSPLIPQGATPPRAKSSLYFKILMVLSVHVVVIGGMLVQGCNNTKDQAKTDNKDGNMLASTDAGATATPPVTAPASATPDVTPIANPSLSNSAYATAPVTSAAATPLTALVPPAAKSTDLTAPAATGDAKEYAIAKGDTMGAIARRNGISLKALMEANPNVNAKKLQIGQKVQIPAATAALAAASKEGAAIAGATETAAADGSVYVVKPGDMLLKIAKSHGTTVKKIMAMNDMKSTSIRAGQKLKLPAPKTSTTSAEPAAATASTSVASLPAVAPVRNPALGSPVAAN
ncbi:MAG TPA: LysM peptidoglycan-binding domain-containing protein [Verrucomicrobiae bacterium]|jgi:LysM repeat protein